MKRLIYLLLFLISFTRVAAQMDTEHWFAPFADRTGGDEAEQYLYLSTNKTTPFLVEIYNNNVIYKTATISKGNPGIVAIDRNIMMAEDVNQMFSTSSMGLHLVAQEKFFAQFRFYVKNHAEIITSKGKAGIGKEFFAFTPEQNDFRNQNFLNSTVGILATENNTIVGISNFNSVTLSNNEVVNNTTVKTITLNKNESYVLEVIDNNSNNMVGLTGLNIKADKSISITNGDALFISPNKNNVDIMMDQASPVDRLGKEYISVKGNGNTTQGMEKVLVIATEDNTHVIVNDGSQTTFTLNKKGESREIDGSNYKIPTGVTADAYNMYISADKKIYAYQLLAGVDDGSVNNYASGGMNILPQLNCLLPNIIEEFALVNEIGTHGEFNTKINIVTEKGAKVKLNGIILSGNYGPFSVLGSSNWETYTFPGVSGNITIESDKAVTAGIASGNKAVGFGGYFAGFNANLVISKGGDCDKGNVTLEVDDTYNIYQWYLNGVPYTGSGANTYIIHPTESGEYYVHIEKIGCGIIDSPVFKYFACPLKTVKNYDIGSCNKIIKITPHFTTSTQTIDLPTIKITTFPSNGTVNINPITGEITYTLTSTTATTDTFTYSFSGIDANFPDTELVTVHININHFAPFNSEVFTCSNILSEGTFILTSVDYSTLNLSAAPEYYLNYNATTGVFSNQILTPNSYYSGLKTIFVKLVDQYGCIGVSEMVLKFYPIPNLNTINFNSSLCDLDFDGNYSVTFSTDVSPIVVNGYQNFNISYYLNPTFTGTPLPDNWSYNTPTRVYILVDSKNGCANATGYIDFNIKPKISVNSYTTTVCDNDLDGKTDVILSDYNTFITSSTTATIKYYTLQNDANHNINSLTNLTQTITKNTTFYVRIEDQTIGCPNTSILTINFNQPLTSTLIKDKIICKNATIVMNAGTGFTNIIWSNGTNAQTATYGVGNHYVDLYSNGCVYRQNFKITESIDPVITSIDVSGSTITVNVSGGNPPYYYSIDGINFQTSNVFTNLPRGIQTVYVQGAEQCTPVKKEFLIINLVNAITPNGDDKNEVLDYSDLSIKKDVKILIYDRYGRKIFVNTNQTNYIWDGKEANRPVPSGTYWYVLEWTEPDTGLTVTFKGWILVKNRK